MYLLNYTEACNKFAQPISSSLRPAGPPRGGDSGTMTPAPMEFRGPMNSRGGPSKWHWEVKGPSKSHVKAGKMSVERQLKISIKTLKFWWRPFFSFFFFFLEVTWFSQGKTVEIPVKTLFFLFSFGDHISFRIKQLHFFRLFWTSHNQNSVMLELAPGPRSALGAPGARATQLLLNNCHNGGEPLATLCLIWISDLSLQKRTRYRSTNRLVETVYQRFHCASKTVDTVCSLSFLFQCMDRS